MNNLPTKTEVSWETEGVRQSLGGLPRPRSQSSAMSLESRHWDYWISASVYCPEIGALVREVIEPFSSQAAVGKMWMLRYSLRGLHLKLRIDIPESQEAAVRRDLESRLERFFVPLETVPVPSVETPGWVLPPIDREDHDRTPVEDRRVVWTQPCWEPQHVGSLRFSAQPGFLPLYFDCLAAATASILERVGKQEPRSDSEGLERLDVGGLALPLRLMTAVASCWRVDGQGWQAWHRSHCDWLMRMVLEPDALAASIESRLESVDLCALEAVVKRPPLPGSALVSWFSAVAELRRFCRIDEDIASPEDSVAVNTSFALVGSRLIHNALNPLGLGVGNEILLSRLLETIAFDGAPGDKADSAGEGNRS